MSKKESTPAAEEPKKEEEKPQKAAPKPEKKTEKKKKKEKGVHSMYKVEGDKVVRLRPTCERCGVGYFMANHKDRYTCGHCGFTRYKQVEAQAVLNSTR